MIDGGRTIRGIDILLRDFFEDAGTKYELRENRKLSEKRSSLCYSIILDGKEEFRFDLHETICIHKEPGMSSENLVITIVDSLIETLTNKEFEDY